MIESVKGTMDIPQYIAYSGNRVRLTDVADHLLVGKITAHHFLKSLHELGCREQDELSPKYRLSDKVGMLIPPPVSTFNFKQRFKPIRQKITELTGETTFSNIFYDNKIQVDKVTLTLLQR